MRVGRLNLVMATAAAAAAIVVLAPLASGQAQPAERPAATTRPVPRRMTWDRVRVNAELARREARAQRELKDAEARHARDPQDAGAARAVEAARRQLEQVRAANETDRGALGGAFPLEKAAYLGVATSPAPAVLRSQLRLPDGVGLLVEYVEPGSPADAAGLEAYDVAVRLNDQILVNPPQLAVLVRTFDAGAEVKLTVVREAKERVLAVKLEQRDVKPLEFVEFGHRPVRSADLAAGARQEADADGGARSDAKARPGDGVRVTVHDLEGPGLQTMKTMTVSDEGEIRLPLLNAPVKVAGLSEVQMQTAVADAYREAGLLHAANVSVALTPRRSVRNPLAQPPALEK